VFKMKSLISATVVIFATLSSAQGYSLLEDHRIFGSDIRAVSHVPIGSEIEAPGVLTITLVDGAATVKEIVFESDDEVESCANAVESIIGSPTSYVQIVVELTADTMNGSLINLCRTFTNYSAN
jgi:hypothetical protein